MREDERSGRQDLGVAFGVALPIAVGVLLVPLRNDLSSANIALVFVVAVMACAVAGGRLAGAVAAVSAVLSYDFFHTQPYLSLRIDSQDDVETAVLLLIVGLVVGTVASRARRDRAGSEAGRSELRRIHRLAEQVAAGAAAADVIKSAQTELTALLGLADCRFEAADGSGRLAIMERTGVITGEREHHYLQGGFTLPVGGVELAVLARGRHVGHFVLVPLPDVGVTLEQRVVAVALADQVGAALADTRQPSTGERKPKHA